MAKEIEKQKKAFNNVKKMNDIQGQSIAFGDIIDKRVSIPVTISMNKLPPS